jgi:hypothetical protein
MVEVSTGALIGVVVTIFVALFATLLGLLNSIRLSLNSMDNRFSSELSSINDSVSQLDDTVSDISRSISRIEGRVFSGTGGSNGNEPSTEETKRSIFTKEFGELVSDYSERDFVLQIDEEEVTVTTTIHRREGESEIAIHIDGAKFEDVEKIEQEVYDVIDKKFANTYDVSAKADRIFIDVPTTAWDVLNDIIDAVGSIVKDAFSVDSRGSGGERFRYDPEE